MLKSRCFRKRSYGKNWVVQVKGDCCGEKLAVAKKKVVPMVKKKCGCCGQK